MSAPEIVIAGVGLTQQTRFVDRPVVPLLLEATTAALDDAGMAMGDIDGVAARWPGPGGTTFHPGSVDWTGQLGIPLRWVQDTYPQGIPAVLDAAAAIGAGYCTTVLIVGGQSGGLGRAGGRVATYTRPDNEFVTPWGAFTSAHFALIAGRAVQRRPELRQAMATVAATIRNHGHDTPGAVMEGRGPYTAEDILTSPLVAEPFRRLDLCLASEGAAALIVTMAERAVDHAQHRPVHVVGGGMEWHRQQYVAPPRSDEVRTVGQAAARRAFDQADVTPADIDVALLYDITSFEVLRQLEILGFCRPGEAPDYVADVGIGRDARLPVNPHGGLLAFAHIGWGGPQLPIVEAVLQLRGTAGARQIESARTAVVTGAGSGAQYHNTLVLRADR
ncbi:thiolase family protein [Euzebya tangerina]|uniref:thiolase family protein n=1 Tax=Euzebya tangerina TaxID=591198 RepID=UPI0013C2D44C|nr:thiolase family protein [Euzebya tangerina]